VRYYLLLIISLIFFNGCYSFGHQDWVSYTNEIIGKKIPYKTAPKKWEHSGKLIRGNFLIGGEGLTHITQDKDGNLIYHISSAEILPIFYDISKPSILRTNKEWVGKCKYYYIVDPKTHIVKNWGFDKGGNPLSCRTWP
jgi:hypothetical protein